MSMQLNLDNSEYNFQEQTNRFINGEKASIQRIHDNLTDYNSIFDLSKKNKSHLISRLNSQNIIEFSLEIYSQLIGNTNKINEGIIHPLTLLKITDDNEFMEKICDFANDFNNSFEKINKNNLDIGQHISSIKTDRTDSLFDKSSKENEHSPKIENIDNNNKLKADDQITVHSILNQINNTNFNKWNNSNEINTNNNFEKNNISKKTKKRNSQSLFQNSINNQNSEGKNSNNNNNNKFNNENDKLSNRKSPLKSKALILQANRNLDFNKSFYDNNSDNKEKENIFNEIKSPKKNIKNKNKYNFKIQVIQTNLNSINQISDLKINNVHKASKNKNNINTIKNKSKNHSKKKKKNIQIKIDIRNISNSKNEKIEEKLFHNTINEDKTKKNLNDNCLVTFNNEKSHYIKSENNQNNKKTETNENLQNKINKNPNKIPKKYTSTGFKNLIYKLENDKNKKNIKNESEILPSSFQLDNNEINDENSNNNLYDEIINELKIPEYKVDVGPLEKKNSNLNSVLLDYKNRNKFLFEITEEEKKLNEQIKSINKTIGNES